MNKYILQTLRQYFAQQPVLLSSFAILLIASCSTPRTSEKDSGWVLEWQEDFNGPTIDTTVWSRIDRGKPDWKNTQSHDDRLYELRNGNLILKGIVNDNLEADTAHYLTGGLYTKDKKAFQPGKFEVRARLHGAKGAWPAIWLLPFDNGEWPFGGEIDIMERLNSDSIAYQTVHSNYTYNLNKTEPKPGSTGKIDPDDFNIYSVEMLPDSIVLKINDNVTLVYPRIKDLPDSLGQYPFMRPQYLLIDMQLGGNWVGSVNPDDLPVEMEVDWVKYYRPSR